MSEKDSDAAPPPYSPHASSPSPSILDQLNTTRTQHIESVVDTYILPLIHQRITYAMATTTLALLPSDTSLAPTKSDASSSSSFPQDAPSSSSDSNSIQVLGFASDTSPPHLIHLSGPINSTEFWKLPTVLHELETVLTARLNPHSTAPTDPPSYRDTTLSPTATGGRSASVQAPSPRFSRRNLLARVMPSLGPEQASPGNNPEVGVRQVDSAISGTSMVMVKARLEEICLRTVSDFGLYDTISKQCVIIKVDAQC
ncbi:hypothetical protein COCC4DRAFT_32606 [Bipolaris maydis ATCC 48331]|uniref:Uncharacterized protein n=2 Tax=Cochliobolus heterostrophus TaxID=5016 RepID=M2VBR1_COCH5|nr:uncharacterized protein COCC4DRAFT_32606 [Bipolaris maydis ATCC 48331]EMD97138.1 hypothetical protein COCHEDRAFT_1018761 [Bipolaris maydis C5]KAH7551489.1 hypothetical protein BM1_09805 [Bipolaris maydis]ENI04397.1 hypothetical protein COCC4DRAFT_32606 [Bipolaris maydis ATCC 48331]KAJ5029591.1 hypothetical protein J3E73DRAFT_286830 [Bipolaris maydis]KAJ5061661.1 hypothetical protein J3E74DRAFT_329139 [Bipolaris maydis]